MRTGRVVARFYISVGVVLVVEGDVIRLYLLVVVSLILRTVLSVCDYAYLSCEDDESNDDDETG